MMRMFGSFVCISTRRGDFSGTESTAGKLFVASGSRNFGELFAAREEFGAFAATSGDRFTKLWMRLRFSFARFHGGSACSLAQLSAESPSTPELVHAADRWIISGNWLHVSVLIDDKIKREEAKSDDQCAGGCPSHARPEPSSKQLRQQWRRWFIFDLLHHLPAHTRIHRVGKDGRRKLLRQFNASLGIRRRHARRLYRFGDARSPTARVSHQGRVRRTAAVIHQSAGNSSRPPLAESRAVLLTIDPDLLSRGTNLRAHGRRTRLHDSCHFFS